MEGEKEETLETPGVLDKYQTAGKIANIVLAAVLKECVVGKQVIDLCRLGDQLIEKEVDKVYNKKKIDKGIGFPTCVSPNHICGHLSPLPEDKVLIQEGDIVKVTLGVQIDGFVAMAAHTVVVNSDQAKVNDGKKADVVLASYKALQAGLRLMRPGGKNSAVTQLFEQVAAEYEVAPVDGVLSHQVKKYLIDNSVCIGIKNSHEQRVEEHEFQQNEVFIVDVIFSSGSGKAKEADMRCTVYKRCLQRNYILKTKQGRVFFGEMEMRFPALPFTIRAFEDQITTKMGIKECLEKQLVVGYPVMAEKAGDVVAQFTYTVAILKGQTLVLAGLPLSEDKFKSAHQLKDPKILQLLSTSIQKKKKQ